MYRGHVNYGKTITNADLEVFNKEIERETNAENPDRFKIAKLKEARILQGLFNNEYTNKGRNMMPW